MGDVIKIVDAIFAYIHSGTKSAITAGENENLNVYSSMFIQCSTTNDGAAINTNGVNSFHAQFLLCTGNIADSGLCCHCINGKQTMQLDLSSFCFNKQKDDATESNSGTNYFQNKPIISTDANYSHNYINHCTALVICYNNNENSQVSYHNCVSNIALLAGVVFQLHQQTTANVYYSNFIKNENGENAYGLIRAAFNSMLSLSYCYAKDNNATKMFSYDVNGQITAEYCCFDDYDQEEEETIEFTNSKDFTQYEIRTMECPKKVKTCPKKVRNIITFILNMFTILIQSNMIYNNTHNA